MRKAAGISWNSSLSLSLITDHSSLTNTPGADATRFPAWADRTRSVCGSSQLHFNRLRAGFLALGQPDGQYAVLELRADMAVVRVVRHGETAGEAPVGAFDPVILPVLLFL